MSTVLNPIDNSIDIVAPENIAFRYEVVGPMRRLFAFALDWLFRGVVFAALLIVMAISSTLLGEGVLTFILLGYFLLEWFYGALFETYWNGQTPGKRIVGIRVVSFDGCPINGLQAVVRNVLRYVDMMPMVPFATFDAAMGLFGFPTCVFGLLAVMSNPRFQRIGDLVAGTMVVFDQQEFAIGVVRLEDPRAAQLAEYIPAAFMVDRRMARALAAYVERRKLFTQQRRQEIARHLGAPLVEQFRLPHDTSHDLLLCALYYRTFLAQRNHSREETP